MPNFLDKKELAKKITLLTELVGGRNKAAKIMEVAPTTLDNYRSGATQPKFLEVLKLTKAAGKQPIYMTGGNVEINTESLIKALTLINKVAAEENKTLPPADMANLIKIIYGLIERGEPADNIYHILNYRRA